MTRNPDAHCGNCPYFWHNGRNKFDGMCRRHTIQGDIIHGDDYWCGEHPDFAGHNPDANHCYCKECR